jgi:hypothetical protein
MWPPNKNYSLEDLLSIPLRNRLSQVTTTVVAIPSRSPGTNMDKVLYSYSQIAARLGVRRETVCDIVKALKIPVVAHPNNGNAKGIDSEGVRAIEEALTPDPEPVSA